MLGQDSRALSADHTTASWRKSPSLSSVTTTLGSPKQRWADLSEDDDDDMDTMEMNYFGNFKREVVGAPSACSGNASDTRQTCAAEAIITTTHQGNSRRSSTDSMAKFPKPEQPSFGVNGAKDSFGWGSEPTGRFGENVTLTPFTMLPESFESHAERYAKNVQYEQSMPNIFTVTMIGIPMKLRSEACLDAILWASGVQRSALGYAMKKNGNALITFASMEAAMHCCNHFKACSWATGKLRVDISVSRAGQNTGGK